MKKFILSILMVFLAHGNLVFANQHKDIFVVNYGWHAGIIVKTDDINSSIWDIEPLFKKFKYIEVGWGDEDFYKNSDPSIWLTLKAALIPTASVLHIRAVTQYELNQFSKENIVKITISKEGFTNLSIFIENSFSKKDDKIIRQGVGLYPNSFFYLSSKTYHIFNTCNVWTAEALQSAKLDISPYSAVTTEDLFSQINKTKKQP
ncbi:MAG: DUF2459 domain-containing protein [Arcobacteraceae bacterium]|nr:DUF2459 domain-containing protein [Arcobacteraceae bacterium]